MRVTDKTRDSRRSQTEAGEIRRASRESEKELLVQ